nr:hypothetical protein B0A51_09137 [Rachicladosporium sp. CCFEE 5018]
MSVGRTSRNNPPVLPTNFAQLSRILLLSRLRVYLSVVSSHGGLQSTIITDATSDDIVKITPTQVEQWRGFERDREMRDIRIDVAEKEQCAIMLSRSLPAITDGKIDLEWLLGVFMGFKR